MAKQNLSNNESIRIGVIYSLIILIITSLINSANKFWLHSDGDMLLFINASFLLLAVVFYPKFIAILRKKLFRKEQIHTEFITSELIRTNSAGGADHFDVDSMYIRLIDMLKGSNTLRIIDNITSNLDGIQNLNSRNNFHRAIEQKLIADKDFRYERIEVAFLAQNQVSAAKRLEIITNVKNGLGANTKVHCENASKYDNAYIGIIAFTKPIGTLIIFDKTHLCFQIDGIDLDTAQPSDLVVMKVDLPNELMIKTYERRFEKLKDLSENYKNIE